jgi:Tfp pilus assembly protein PilO
MSASIFDKMNLRPQERRLVVIVGMVIFVLLNMWFVWPFFNDWARVRNEIEKNRSTLDRYKREIAQRPKYEARQRELETTGSQMLQSENDLQRVVQSQAAASGIQIIRGPAPISSGKTNQFYKEIGVSLDFTSGGKEVVDFLVGVAAQNAMIRVREMQLSPEPPQQQRLRGRLVLVGNFQQQASTNAPSRKVAAAAPPRK